VLGGELLLELVDGDLKVHGLRIKGSAPSRGVGLSGHELSSIVRDLPDANASGLTIGGERRRMARLSASKTLIELF
jgi:hypothetical protein